MDRLFFLVDDRDQYAVLDGGVQGIEIWKPSLRNIVPRGLPIYPFAIFWLFHYFRIFSNRAYSILLVRDGSNVVHRSTVVPRYFRFPFMEKEDVQIATWTAPDYRGRGLARLALKQARELTRMRLGRLWYIAKEGNSSSVHVARSSGFTLVGRGSRVARFGSQVLGKFVMEARVDSRKPVKTPLFTQNT